MNGIDAAAKINAITGKGFKFSIDIDTRLSAGCRRIARRDLEALGAPGTVTSAAILAHHDLGHIEIAPTTRTAARPHSLDESHHSTSRLCECPGVLWCPLKHFRLDNE